MRMQVRKGTHLAQARAPPATRGQQRDGARPSAASSTTATAEAHEPARVPVAQHARLARVDVRGEGQVGGGQQEERGRSPPRGAAGRTRARPAHRAGRDGLARRHRAAHTTSVSRCSPNTARRRPAISPTVAQASTASTIAGTRLPPRRARPPRARPARPARRPASRRARSARTRSTCARSRSGSMRRMSAARRLAVLREAVDAHDHALARLHLPLVPVGRLLDLALDLAALDRAQRAALRLDARRAGAAPRARARRWPPPPRRTPPSGSTVSATPDS